MSWHAFVKHVKETQPSRFTDLKKRSDVLHEAKAIREEDGEGYNSFVSAWKASRLALVAPLAAEEIIVVAPAPIAAPVVAEVKEKEKRKAAPATMAWHAFVKHCKDTMPELASISFAEKLLAIKARKENDKAGYETFVNVWKAAQPVA
jgi:hypothetical protein